MEISSYSGDGPLRDSVA